MKLIDKIAVVAEIDDWRDKIKKFVFVTHLNGRERADISLEYEILGRVRDFLDTLEVIDPYECCVQYPSVKDAIQRHAETYSFNIESELFPQLTKEQQKLWRKEIEYACISGGDMGYILAKDPRYKENYEVKEMNLEEYINELSKQFPEVSFAKLSRIAVRVAKWQKENLWKPADGDDLPEYEREVVVFTQDFPNDAGIMKVAIAHRPNPKGWDGKSITTGKVEHYTPKTYGKGGWNSPDIKWWLDLELPCGGRTISMNYTDKNKEKAK